MGICRLECHMVKIADDTTVFFFTPNQELMETGKQSKLLFLPIFT